MLPENFAKMVGMWDGSKKLILMPEDPVHECEAVACVGLEANGKFLKVNYEWSFKGEKKEGLAIFHIGKEDQAKCVWIDSFHQSDDFMLLSGNLAERKISTKAHYTQPEYSDWAWRINIDATDENSFALVMFNIFPDGTEVLAVDAKFKRRV